MKQYLAILFLIFEINVFSQIASYRYADTFNYIDKSGLKQGKWIKKEKDTLVQIYDVIVLDDESGKDRLDTDKLICTFIFYTGYYLNDKKDSVWRIYDTDNENNDHKLTHADTIKSGKILYEATFKLDKLNGLLKTFYPNGKLKSEIEFKNGNADGSVRCYFTNGKPQLTGQIIYGNDYFSGIEYSSSGYKIRERNFSYKKIFEDWTDLRDIERRLKEK